MDINSINQSLPNINPLSLINLEPIKQLVSISLKVIIAIVIIWIIIKLITFIRESRIRRRIILTYSNSEEIKKKLDLIDKKLDQVLKKKK